MNWNSIYDLSVAAVGFTIFFGIAFPNPLWAIVFIGLSIFAVYANGKCRKAKREGE